MNDIYNKYLFYNKFIILFYNIYLFYSKNYLFWVFTAAWAFLLLQRARAATL